MRRDLVRQQRKSLESELAILATGHAATDALGRITLFRSTATATALPSSPSDPMAAPNSCRCTSFLGRTDHVQLTSALADLPRVEDLIVRNYTGSHDVAGQLLARAQPPAAFLDLPWDDDRESWFTLLRGASIVQSTERVVLTPDEHAAYERVTERILAAWRR